MEERRAKPAQVLEHPSVLAAKEQSSQPTSEGTDDSTAQPHVGAKAESPKREGSLLEKIKIAEDIAAVTQLEGEESSRSMAKVSLTFPSNRRQMDLDLCT